MGTVMNRKTRRWMLGLLAMPIFVIAAIYDAVGITDDNPSLTRSLERGVKETSMPRIPDTPERQLRKVSAALAAVLRKVGVLASDQDPSAADLTRLAAIFIATPTQAEVWPVRPDLDATLPF